MNRDQWIELTSRLSIGISVDWPTVELEAEDDQERGLLVTLRRLCDREEGASEIFLQALDLAPAARAAFLQSVCGGDDELRRDVQSLLDALPRAEDAFAVSFSLEGALGDSPNEVKGNEVPAVLGRYRIESELGRGGMGVVFRAQDDLMEREVALKLLSRHVAADTLTLHRFAREARLLAAIGHPSIAEVYSLETDRDACFLTMELVTGDPLSTVLRQGPMPLEAALSTGRDIAGALEAAHSRGVVHRDLKPANVMVSPAGEVKVLDFGIAASADPMAGGASRAGDAQRRERPVESDATVVAGTPGYMSPEQIRGERVDYRCDLFAFGCVLFECLTGQRVVRGRTVAERMSHTLEGPFDLSILPKDLPESVRELVERCLDLEGAGRPDSTTSVRQVLDAAVETRVLEHFVGRHFRVG